MGHDLARAFPAARAVFEEVDDVLNEPLSRIIWEGPADRLTLTKNAQPALMTVSMAALAVLKQEYGVMSGVLPTFVAGHSLGEYSALAAVGVFSIADAAKLLRLRGLAMQEAVPEGQGAMLALLGAELDQAEKLALAAADGKVCQVANDNGSGQVVISGAKEPIERAARLAAEFGIRRAVPLPVSAPFHCALMKPAADRMEQALRSTPMKAPLAPLVSNVTAQPTSDPIEIRSLLVQQVTGFVRWRESVTYIVDHGVNTLFEIGAGRVLSGLAKRIRTGIDAPSVGTLEEIAAFGDWLKGRMAA
jgi:[acyl-carrier-protein] S-malonyltransferase